LAARLGISPRTLPTILERIRAQYVTLHPEVDPYLPPLAAARCWALESEWLDA
jgi:hypothetical protein